MRLIAELPRRRAATAANPPNQVIVNRRNPLAWGLDWLWVARSQRGAMPDLVAGALPQVDGTFNWGPLGAPSGYGFQYTQWEAARTQHMQYAGLPFTVMVAFYDLATPVAGQFPAIFGRYSYTNETNNQGWAITGESTGGYGFRVYRNNSIGNYVLSAGGYIRGDRVLVATSDGSTRTTYRDGVQVASSGTNASPLGTSTATVIAGGLGSNLEYVVRVAATWRRVLAPDEIAALARDPMQLVAAPGPILVPGLGGALVQQPSLGRSQIVVVG